VGSSPTPGTTEQPAEQEAKSKKMSQVDNYIEKQESPQKEIAQKLRKIILATFPNIKEEFKLGVPWYEGKYYIVSLKNHVNLGFSLKDLSKEEQKLIEGGGKTMKHIKFCSLTDVDEQKIIKLLKLVDKK
jgi:hypothetical protein